MAKTQLTQVAKSSNLLGGKFFDSPNCSGELSNLGNLRSRKPRFTVFIPWGCGVDWARGGEHRAYAAARHPGRTKLGGGGTGGLYGGLSGVYPGVLVEQVGPEVTRIIEEMDSSRFKNNEL